MGSPDGERSLITATVLGRIDQLRSHLSLALDDGATRDELVEPATHLAFYADRSPREREDEVKAREVV